MSKVKAGIITFLGTNCEQETMRACELFGWDTEFIWQNDIIKKTYDIKEVANKLEKIYSDG